MILPIIVAVLLLIADQVTKILYVASGCPDVTLIPHVLSLTYVENRGAAWGMFADNQLPLYIISGAMTAVLIWLYFKDNKKFDGLMKFALMLVISGAIGNMTDRIAFSYVRDMINFEFISFPVFNVADSCITIGAIMLIVDCIFFGGRNLFRDNEEKSQNSQDTEAEDE